MSFPSTSKPLVWLVTGCSSGLGAEIVKEAIRRGDKVIATARNAERIHSLEPEGGGKVKVLELDICQPSEYVESFMQKAIGVWGHIDILVNNAGQAYVGPVECARSVRMPFLQCISQGDPSALPLLEQPPLLNETSEKDCRDLFEANFFGPLRVTKAILANFRQRRQGTIIFVGSRSSQITMPFVGVYSASKAGMSLMSECLAQEMRPFGVRVFCFDPSSMNTPAFSKMPQQYITPSIQDYQEMADKFVEVASKKWEVPKANSAKVSTVIVDFARGEGCTLGQDPLPVRLPIGSEVRQQLQERLKQTQNMLDRWQAVIDGVDGVN